MVDLAECWKQGRLPDDLPRLIEANIVQIPEGLLKGIDARIAEGVTNVFDTHPSDKDRIAVADAWRAPGVFHIDGPATALFRDFDALSRECTARHYQMIVGEAFSPDRLRTVSEAVREVERRKAAHDALGRVLPGRASYLRTVPLPSVLPAAPLDLDLIESQRVLSRLRAEQQAGRAEHDERLALQDEALDRLRAAEAADLMLAAGFDLKFSAHPPSAVAREALARAIAERGERIEQYDAICAERIVRCLALLEDDGFASALDDGAAMRDEVRRLHPIASKLGDRVWPAVSRLVEATYVLLTILEQYEGNERNAALHKAVVRGVEPVLERIAELKAAVGTDLPYPFDHAEAGITLEAFVFPAPFDVDDVMAVVNAAQGAVSGLASVYFEVLSRLATAVERVEAALGLQPLAIDAPTGDNHPADVLASNDTRVPS
jgi:hypothetical protein